MRSDRPTVSPTARVEPTRSVRSWRAWAIPILAGTLLFAVLLPLDSSISTIGKQILQALTNDLRRDLTAWQQYGQLSAAIVASVIIFLLDPEQRRRLFDLFAAFVIAVVPLFVCRFVIGRARPSEAAPDPSIFLRSIGNDQFGINNPSSFLSAHVMYAVIFSIFLSALYPKLRWLAIVLAGVVATGRIVLGGHWATDVVAGATVGWVIGVFVIDNQMGVRVWDSIRGKF